ncbi:DUF4398 domain-containing protein [Luteimonas viscosa]|uniref:DUF4398 domain-containing protein n=1 Tax=Luteimonas viscosa TaxID=1132694 RepID=A0A5D4XR03_9GAMM|nr:DUF4398 domain-containing protein [Luteimonas viscosa]TYT27117.1 DUF4398 domain-containing protein [Luteimonas viscosa]
MPASFAQFRLALQALVCGCVLALTACASMPPPTAELNAAQQAVSRAADADADQYAADELQRARSLLTQAQAAMAAGRESEARDLATRADALAGLAAARSREAATDAELGQRRAEIADLRQRLRMEETP